jgi:tetratricopeptide (TPR) repeat protein
MNSKIEDLRLVTVVSQLASGPHVAIVGEASSQATSDLRRNGFQIEFFRDVGQVRHGGARTFVVLRPDLMDGFWHVAAEADLVVVLSPDQTLVDRAEASLRSCGFRTHPRQFKYCGYSQDEREWPLFVAQRRPSAEGGILSQPLERSTAALQLLSFLGGFSRPGDRLLIVGDDVDVQDVMRTSTSCSAILSDGADGPVDFVLFQSNASIEEAVAQEAAAAAARLTPGGRFLAVFPLPGTGERVPGVLAGIRSVGLTLEKVFVQGLSPRCLHDVTSVERPAGDWCAIVAATDPVISNGTVRFKDTIYPGADPTENLLAFGRDYGNPWLMRSFFGMSVRTENREVRLDVARRLEAASARTDADRGSAICVRGYDVLSTGSHAERTAFIAAAEPYLAGVPENPHALRWQVSIAFLCGLLHQEIGELDAAVRMYDRVVDMPWIRFSPTLGTKPAEAAYRAGLILERAGDLEGARGFWKRGVKVVAAVMNSSFAEVVGDVECPLPDALPETIQALSLARKCADRLRATHPDWQRGEGTALTELVSFEDGREILTRLSVIEAENKALRGELAASSAAVAYRRASVSTITRMGRLLKSLLSGQARRERAIAPSGDVG